MFKEFEAGDHVRTLCDIYDQEGNRRARKGEMFKLEMGCGHHVLTMDSLFIHSYGGSSYQWDYTGMIEKIPAQKMTVSQIAKKLGHEVEIVEG